ncbi:MAG: prolipoprotein diacylglyceryl transferase [Bacteroidota bacterium]
MYPDLSYLFADFFGTEPDNWLSIFKTFGFFLLMAFVSAAWLLKLELKRREKLGQFTSKTFTIEKSPADKTSDTVINAIVGFLLGYKLPYAFAHFDEWKLDPAAVLLSTDGNFLTGLVGAALFAGYYYWLGKRDKTVYPRDVKIFPSDRIGPITFAAAIGGLVGAKVFAIIEDLPGFFRDPAGVFFSGTGLAIYGGLIGGALAVIWYLRKNDIAVLPFTDAVAPALMVSYGVGRIGCQLSGDGDWGITAGPQPDWWFLPDWMWSFTYPHSVIFPPRPEGYIPYENAVKLPDCDLQYCYELAEAAYPTPFYETVMAFAIGAILWSLRKKLTPIPGLLFGIYLIFNGIERFFIEFIRVNDTYDFAFGLTQAQIIAIGFVVGGIGMAVWARRRASL